MTQVALPLIRKLALSFRLSTEESEAIAQLPFHIRDVPGDFAIVSDGDRPTQCVMIVEGFACRYKILGEGKRQIFSFHIPGDIPDLQSLHLEVMDHSLATVMPSRIATLQHDPLRAFLRAHPRIADAFWRDTLIDAAIFREWMASVARRDASSRVAHLLCELYIRIQAIGRTTDHTYELPLTQEELADALGLSTVHVNRTLQELRAEGLIRSGKRTVAILDWARLREVADFDPAYLHFRSPIPTP